MNNTQELDKELRNATGDEKLKTLLELSQSNLSQSLEKSLEYGKRALELAEAQNNKKGKSKSLSVIGLSYYHLGDIEHSLKYFSESLKLFEELKDKAGIAQLTRNIGRAYRSFGNFDKALEFLFRSLDLTEEIDDKSGIANTLNGIGVLYGVLEENQKALEYYNMSLNMYKSINDKFGMSKVLNNIGVVYWKQEEYHNALDYLLESLKIDEEFGDKKNVAASLNNIGLLYTKLGNYDKVLEYYLRALELRKEIGDKSEIATSFINISDLYIQRKDFNKASLYLDKALELSKEIDSKELLLDCYECFQGFYYLQENYKKSLEYYKKYSDIKSILFSEQSNKQIAKLQIKYEAEKKEKEAEIYRLKNIELEKASRDIEIKNEEIIRQRNKLNQLNKDKDIFFSIVAHDLKAPFTGLLGFSEILTSDAESISREEVKELSIDMYNVASGLFNLLENLMQWSKIQTGGMEFLQTNFDLKELIENSLKLFNANANKKSIKISSEIPSGLKVYADRNMMDTVIRNLLSNSIKFTPRNGSVRIFSEKKNGVIYISIEDTGIGMDEEQINSLFIIGKQYSERDTENEKGSGLGLILCKEFIEKNGGNVSVKSEKGKGSVFSISIPSG